MVNREAIEHEPVLHTELLSIGSPQPGETVVDATVGHGGHSRLLAQAIGPTGRLIGLDVDPVNLERARRRLDAAGVFVSGPRVDLVRENFAGLESVLDSLGVERVDLVVADLGVSTDQLLSESGGLTFSQDGPLDMRLDDRLDKTAADLVNALSENELSDLIYFNSQERFSRRIARQICQARRRQRIRRTGELVRIVCTAVGTREDAYHGRIHPATRTFLALRMAVNHEIENLRALLEGAMNRLSMGGRLAVISFHSGEDRIVKQFFLEQRRAGRLELLTRKPVAPSSEELNRNHRARSAKLRVARRVATEAATIAEPLEDDAEGRDEP